VDLGKREQAQAVNDYYFFNGNTLILHELGLANYNVPWCSPTLGGLSTLWLCNLASSIQLTITELRTVLGWTLDLVQLHLENVLRSSPTGSSSHDSEKLHLPSLVHLLITAPFSGIHTLSSYVEIPSMVQVRLTCQRGTRTRADDSALCSCSGSVRPRQGKLFHPHSRDMDMHKRISIRGCASLLGHRKRLLTCSTIIMNATYRSRWGSTRRHRSPR